MKILPRVLFTVLIAVLIFSLGATSPPRHVRLVDPATGIVVMPVEARGCSLKMKKLNKTQNVPSCDADPSCFACHVFCCSGTQTPGGCF